MVICPPEEIEKLREIFEPYMEGCHLKKDAPQEAKEALEKYDNWYEEVQGDWQ